MKYITITRRYQCDLCLAGTDDREEIEQHMKLTHKWDLEILEKWEKDHKEVVN